jgi:hypothetical protein
MLNLKTTVSVPTEVSIELETPAFYKQNTYSIAEYIAVLDETTIKIYIYPEQRTRIENEATERCEQEIIGAYKTWEHISEEEFFEALDKALKDFNFKPTLRHVTASNGSEVTI